MFKQNILYLYIFYLAINRVIKRVQATLQDNLSSNKNKIYGY